MSVETYAALLNLKRVVPASKSNYVALDRDYWISSMSSTLDEVDLDEFWYLKKNPDVQKAIEAGLIANAREHYRQSGYYEHRMPYHINVNDDWYLAQYDDVRDAIAKRVFGSAQQHFEEVGFREGRHPFPDFALRARGTKLKVHGGS